MRIPSSRPPRGVACPRSWAWWFLGVSSLAVLLVLCGAMLSVARLVLSEVSWLPADTEWIPNPLPFHGQLPRFELRDVDGASFGTRQLRGRAYVLQFLGEERRSRAQDLVARLSSVEHRLEAEQLPVRFVVVTPHSLEDVSGSSPVSWHVLVEDQEWEAEVLTLLRERAPEQSTQDRFSLLRSTLLVDQAGGLRGVYDLTGPARAVEALVADARQVSVSGPVPAVAGLPMDHPHVLGVGCAGAQRRY
ncbi:hypothetical protein ACN469_36975 [Corallococcus terminator]